MEMMWKYREPSPDDFESRDEYEKSMEAYAAAEYLYMEDCHDNHD